MRSNGSRLALLGAFALAVGAFAVPGVAQAAKVSETAAGGVLPAGSDNGGVGPDVHGEFVQTFRLSGEKVKKRQITDVNLIVNASGSELRTMSAVLIAPKRANTEVDPFLQGATTLLDLEFDDQSRQRPCNTAPGPFGDPGTVRSDCNYVQNGILTGSIHEDLNPTFKGGNPKGRWTLHWFNSSAFTMTPSPVTIGETTLEVKTGKKFAKEDK